LADSRCWSALRLPMPTRFGSGCTDNAAPNPVQLRQPAGYDADMSRKFQVSLRVIFAVTSIVATGCAIWINLPITVRCAIAVGAAGFLWSCVFPPDFGFTDFLLRAATGRSSQRYVIKIRGKQAGQRESEDQS